nr:hypothetical protein [Tanacetum cinerariifolium]
YMDISSPFEELSDIGSPRADDHEHLMFPEMLEDPYVEVALQAQPSPDYVIGPEHANDEIIAEDQPYAEDASPIAQSPELLAISSLTTSPLSPWSLPPPQISFPPLPPILSPPSPILSPAPPPSPIRSLGYRAAMIRLGDEAASTSSPPLQIPSASRREDRPEVTLPPRKRLDIALSPRYEVGESSFATAARPAGGLRADYGFGAPVSTDTELGGYVREFETRVRQDTDEIYMRLDDEQTERQLLAGRLNMLFRDKRAHAYTRHLMETEARMSREAWVRATDASDLVHELLRIDHRRSTEISELRTSLQGQVTALQGQVTALQAHVTTLQELALLCERMFSEESDKIEKYVGGLPDMIHRSVVASKPKTMQKAIEIATELMDKKIRTFAERETASKR